MKIVLVSIISSPAYGNSGVEYIAHRLREDLDNEVVIKYFHNLESKENMLNELNSKFDIIGFSVYPTNYKIFIAMAAVLKEKFPDSVIIMGGGFVTLNWRDIVNDMSNIDYLIIGDGEEPLYSLIQYYKRNNSLKEYEHPSVVTKTSKDDKFIYNDSNINRWCDFDYYKNFQKNNTVRKIHCLFTKSNVCTGKCTFCCSRKGRIQYKSIERIVDEIYYVATNYGIRHFYFSDDDIFDVANEDNTKRLMDLFNRINKLGMNLLFSAFAKADSIKKENIELYKLMSKIGFYFIFLGIDAGNEQDRILYNKRASLEQNLKALKLLEDVGIWVRYGLIGFNPYSTRESIKENYFFLKKAGSINFYHYGAMRLQIYKGTALYLKVKEDGLLKDSFSFLNVYDYKYQHECVEKIMRFVNEEFIPQIDKISPQFLTLKKNFEMTIHINPKAYRYRMEIEKYEKKEREMINEFFYHLYVQYDLDFCRESLPSFIDKMRKRSKYYKELINEIKNIYNETEMEKL